jgi:hypothetical protein
MRAVTTVVAAYWRDGNQVGLRFGRLMEYRDCFASLSRWLATRKVGRMGGDENDEG